MKPGGKQNFGQKILKILFRTFGMSVEEVTSIPYGQLMHLTQLLVPIYVGPSSFPGANAGIFSMIDLKGNLVIIEYLGPHLTKSEKTTLMCDKPHDRSQSADDISYLFDFEGNLIEDS
ncbi:hypothetical protein GEMRC1_000614 [Eukaryota sp. GEM-RC1]